ncbi:MAG: uracil-DNA glycosylase [Candidatus Abyssobacteria bacterium SURF_5]|uniref:Type-4 uracil-DNA glycosylase n=1 Tax=Abyssobacteria bacterium (strain SURF_5) TaxID=2093360 RepID=A0A3A4NGM2_ABYX5|nr:MAG: uracil-DNA glycosylase [Candidatus Abyssubacteria bacterium SURF_5]
MKHDERASAELLEVIELAKRFLEQQKTLGLQKIRLSRAALSELDNVASSDSAERQRDAAAAIAELASAVQTCTKCHLSRSRKNVVPGQGNPYAKLMFIGEAPGADEDEQGLPFVGKAGQLLTRIIAAINLKREDVYICNILKCRPPDNRTPSSDEIECCLPFVMEQVRVIHPKFICALGNVAAQTLLQTKAPMNRLRGKFHKFGEALLMPTYHPAALLRNADYKKPTWEDMQMIQRELEKL